MAEVSAAGSFWLEEGDGAGVSASVAVYPFRSVGIVGDLGHYGDLGNSTMAGVRFRFPGSRVTPFFQVLAGEAPLDTFALQPGLGLDWHLARNVSARLAADLKLAGDDGSSYTGLRLSAGVVFGIGAR